MQARFTTEFDALGSSCDPGGLARRAEDFCMIRSIAFTSCFVSREEEREELYQFQRRLQLCLPSSNLKQIWWISDPGPTSTLTTCFIYTWMDTSDGFPSVCQSDVARCGIQVC
ncbi:unnamed protein product [Effrenium voratum]|nr:unnamed protein product [Effrenium voratum]